MAPNCAKHHNCLKIFILLRHYLNMHVNSRNKDVFVDKTLKLKPFRAGLPLQHGGPGKFQKKKLQKKGELKLLA